MPFVIVLLLLVAGSVLFHLFSPWQATEAASNWGSIDTTLLITVVITGIFFVAISLFIVIAVLRFRHRAGRRAAYEPENRRLEWWLVAITSVGIVLMLAPGLVVYDDFIRVPKDAYPLEVVGQQWQWSFRFAGEDGKLGRSDIRHVGAGNPFGLDPDDPHALDDRLVQGNELHLPLDRPVHVLLRSKDVLHNFYVPQMRAKMDMVPGMVSYFWFTPTRTGMFEILCAEFCGVGHYNMRGRLYVETPEDFDRWLAAQTTFAQARAGPARTAASPLVERGRLLAAENGCLACHSIDGGQSVGPGWQGLHGSEETLVDGSRVTVDDDYLAESITAPNARVVQGYPPIMPAYALPAADLEALVAYMRSLSAADPSAATETEDPRVAEGRTLAQSSGCLACHSVDGSPSVGPGWLGLYGREEELADGSRVRVDDAYLLESLRAPNAQLVRGFSPVMPAYSLESEQEEALIAYIRSLGEAKRPETGQGASR